MGNIKQTNNQQRLHRIHTHLMDWFNQHKRDLPWRTTPREAYKVWISEMMLQQTQVDTVIPYFEDWMAKWPKVQDLARASEDQVLKAWEGLGYYARARNILKTARLIREEAGGSLPTSYKELLKLPGIGPYSAAAIASYTSGQAIGAVDANVLRVLSRLNQIEWTAGEPKSLKDCQNYLSSAMEALSKMKDWGARESASKNEFDNDQNFQAGPLNEALIELGALICRSKKAACQVCPLKQDCLAFAYNSIYDFPLAKDKIAKKEEYYSLLILYQKDLQRFAVEQRPSKGLLGGLWQFPLLEGLRESDEIKSYLEDNGYQVFSLRKLEAYRHAFSHLVWNIVPYIIVIGDGRGENLPASEKSLLKESPDSFCWLPAKSLMDLPFSSSMTHLRDSIIKQDLSFD